MKYLKAGSCKGFSHGKNFEFTPFLFFNEWRVGGTTYYHRAVKINNPPSLEQSYSTYKISNNSGEKVPDKHLFLSMKIPSWELLWIIII